MQVVLEVAPTVVDTFRIEVKVRFSVRVRVKLHR